MNIALRNEIVLHILSNFGVKSSNSKLLINKEFKLDDAIKIKDENEIILSYNIYGCQFSAEQQLLKVIITKIENEYFLLTQLKDAPFYGIYSGDKSNIVCSLDGKSWLDCNTYLQSVLLSGLESIKENGLFYAKCIDPKIQIDALKSFILFQDENEN